MQSVFIHSSIKTRIETFTVSKYSFVYYLFLYIVPLKQGLKHDRPERAELKFRGFLYIVPLKQGLKLINGTRRCLMIKKFLYIVPLKQGLKQKIINILWIACGIVFIHSSIKTRIETESFRPFLASESGFLYIVPLKQGLKLSQFIQFISNNIPFLYIVPLKQGLKQSNTRRRKLVG